jgi:hypothetical protein
VKWRSQCPVSPASRIGWCWASVSHERTGQPQPGAKLQNTLVLEELRVPHDPPRKHYTRGEKHVWDGAPVAGLALAPQRDRQVQNPQRHCEHLRRHAHPPPTHGEAGTPDGQIGYTPVSAAHASWAWLQCRHTRMRLQRTPDKAEGCIGFHQHTHTSPTATSIHRGCRERPPA